MLVSWLVVLGLGLVSGSASQVASESPEIRLAPQDLPQVIEPLRYVQLSGFRLNDLVALQGTKRAGKSLILSGAIQAFGIEAHEKAVRFSFDKAKLALALIRNPDIKEDVVVVATFPIFKPDLEAIAIEKNAEVRSLEQTLVTTTDGTPAKLTLFPLADNLVLYSGQISFDCDWLTPLLPKLTPTPKPVDRGGGHFGVPMNGIFPAKRLEPQVPTDFDWSSVSETTVILKVFLNLDGMVTGAELIRGNPVLGKSAREAILQWTFNVGTLSLPEHAQTIETVVPIHFVKPEQ